MRSTVALVAVTIALAGCSASRQQVAVAPPVMPAQPVLSAMPLPPAGAATNVVVPARGPDGSYLTPNRNVSAAAAAWHVRAALNVAALRCADPAGTLAVAYNRFLTTQKAGLAAAHKALSAEYGDTAVFDSAMTRLYNYFSLPPAGTGFCAAAVPIAAQAAALPAGGLPSFAGAALTELDRPFADFYRAYDDYRTALTSWQATGGRATAQIAYDPAVFATAHPTKASFAAR
jgi:hypothetical protein